MSIMSKRKPKLGPVQVQPLLSEPRQTWVAPVGLAVLAAGLLWLSFFPANLGFLGWIALVPFLALTVRPSPRWVYPAAFLGGLAFGLPAVQWVRLAAPPMYLAWIGLALLLAVHFLLFVFLTRWLVLSVRFPLLLAAPVVWVALEFGRAHIDIGFAWYLLGHTQHDYLPMIQVADVFGAYGLSFLVMMANVAIFQGACWLLERWRSGAVAAWFQVPIPTGRVCLRSAALGLVLVMASLAYGGWRLSQNEFETGPKISLVQGNVPQDMRNDPKQGDLQDQHFDELGAKAGLEAADLIVFPETSYTFHWLLVPTEQQDVLTLEGLRLLAKCRAFGVEKPRDWNAMVLLGINSMALGTEKFHARNSAILLGRDGTTLGQYDKCCRVPFGEYLPFVETLPFMKYLSPYDFDYGIDAGQELTQFEIPGERPYRFGVLICYEDSVPHLAPQFLRLQKEGRPLDFFLNISNDGWFKGSEEHEQHLVAARFRAVECRRSIARAVNMGISTVIDGNGQIVALPGPTWGTSKGVAAIVTAYIPIDHRWSLYGWWGDVLPLGCVAVLLVAIVLAVVSTARKARAG